MFQVGMRVRICGSGKAPGVRQDFTGCTGVVEKIIDVVAPNYRGGKRTINIRLDSDVARYYGSAVLYFNVEDVEEEFTTPLAEGYNRCKCGTITSNPSTCCECGAKGDYSNLIEFAKKAGLI